MPQHLGVGAGARLGRRYVLVHLFKGKPRVNGKMPHMVPASHHPRCEHSLGSSFVVLDDAMCRRVAQVLMAHKMPLEHEESAPSGLSETEVGNFYLFLIAICHQTSPLNKAPLEGTVDRRHLRGWDYLAAKFESRVQAERSLLLPSVWRGITEQDIRDLFRDEANGERLTDAANRAFLVRDLGTKMIEHGWSSANSMFDLSGGSIATAPNNLLKLLSRFRAYDDPVGKKSAFFLSVMRNSANWKYNDPQNLGAPIDYHELRGHLRIGTIRISNSNLMLKVAAQQEITRDEDIAIRAAVHEALLRISDYSGVHDPSRVHYAFWNIFRSCCTRTHPHCNACPPNCSLPEQYIPFNLFADGRRRCAFSAVCQSADAEIKVLEPKVNTDYY